MTGLFEELADNAPVMIWRSRADTMCDFFNKPWLAFTGHTHEQACTEGWSHGIYPEDYDRCLVGHRTAFDTRQSFSMEYRRRRNNGDYRWLLDNGAPFFRSGDFAGYFGSCIDITERKELEAGHAILIEELNHRVKNMLSTVQSLAHTSCARARTPQQAEALLNGRLMALSQVQEVLAESQWKHAYLGEIVRRIGSLASLQHNRVRMSGDMAVLAPTVVQVLSMAFHELFLNAAQYGALSNDAGVVDIGWTRIERRGASWVEIVWQEKGGPGVAPPRTRGLGLRLIGAMLPAEIVGETEIEFPKDGVVCRIRMPLALAGQA